MARGKGPHAELLEAALVEAARKAGEVWPLQGSGGGVDSDAQVQGGVLIIFGQGEHAGFSCHAPADTSAQLPSVLRGMAYDIEGDMRAAGHPGHVRTLGDELPREMARVRDQVMPHYLAIGAEGVPALMMMRAALDGAAVAAVAADLVGMLHAYQDLQGFTP